MTPRAAAVLSGLWLATPGAAQVAVEVLAVQPVADALAGELRAVLGDGVEVRATGGGALAAPGSVLIAPEPRLQQLLRERSFVPLRPSGDLAATRRESEGRWLLPWSLRYAVVTAGIEASGLTSFEALALAGAVHDRLLLCPPEVDAGPWLLGMQECLLRGQQEAGGFGLWTALDARAERYCRDLSDVLGALAKGRPQAAVVPRPLLRRPGMPPGCAVTDLASDAGIPLGVAVVAPGSAPALAVAARLLEPALRRRVAEALDLSLGSPRDARFPGEAILLWLRHHEQRIAGQGRGVERVADVLDWVFTLVFVAGIAFVWRRQRRAVP